MRILTVFFNRQIMKYLDANALAIYGPIINISTFVQCCAHSVGQASQPIVSANFSAGRGIRIRKTLRLALWTTVFFGVFWTALSMICPNLYIRIFMNPTPEIPDAAPAIVRSYALPFLLLPFNIFFTYYFQSIMKPGAAFVVSVARGLVISGILILVLPALGGASSPVVCHAGHGTAGHGLCRNHDREIYKSSAGSVPCRGLTHGDRWIPGEA